MLKRIENNIEEIKKSIGGLEYSIDKILLEDIECIDSISSKLTKIEILERKKDILVKVLEKSLELRERLMNK